MVETIEKVVAYITRADELLGFKHTHHPEAGIQVPAGTLNPGEAPEDAVLRECFEETGLTDFIQPEFLSQQDFSTAFSGKLVRIRRFFYHIECKQMTPESWTHMEQEPSEGPPGLIEFSFFWVRFPNEVPELSGELGAFLHMLPQFDR